MLDYTKVAVRQMIDNFKKMGFILNLVLQIVYILYLTYAIITQRANLVVNIILLTISCAYLVFYLVVTRKGKNPDGEIKKLKNGGRNVFKWTKLAIRAYALGVAIYGVCTTVEKVSEISVLLTAAMVAMWIFQIIFDVVYKIIESQFGMVIEGLEADIENLMKPVTSIKNAFKKLKGEEVVQTAPSKRRLKLDAKVMAARREKAEQKQLAKQRKAEEKQLARQRKAEEKQLAKQRKAEEKALAKASGKKSSDDNGKSE